MQQRKPFYFRELTHIPDLTMDTERAEVSTIRTYSESPDLTTEIKYSI